jgi:hypothetical protein
LAHLCLVGSSTTLVRAKIEANLPRKRGPAIAGYDKAWDKFMDQVQPAEGAGAWGGGGCMHLGLLKMQMAVPLQLRAFGCRVDHEIVQAGCNSSMSPSGVSAA